jgi:hypothetical protein
LHRRLGEKTPQGRRGMYNRPKTPNRNLHIGVVSLILLLLSAFAHSSAVLAVLEIIPSEVEEELTINELRLLSDELRRQAVNILPANEFNVLTRDGLIALIPADEKEAECLAQSCAVDIGRAIGAEYISSGRIAKFAGKLSLTVELYETMGGRLLGSFLTYGTDIIGLMETIRAESPAMFEKVKAHYFAGKEKPKSSGNEKLKAEASIETEIKDENSSSGLLKLNERYGLRIALKGVLASNSEDGGGSDGEDGGDNSGFEIGLLMSIPIVNIITFNPEVNFNYRRFYFMKSDFDEFVINIPILFQLTPFAGSSYNMKDIYLEGGIQLDFPLVTKIYSNDDKKDYTDRANLDFGIALGCGLHFKHFVFGIRGIIGLTDFDANGNSISAIGWWMGYLF